MPTESEQSIMSKTANELTVADNLKIVGVVYVVSFGVPLAVCGLYVGAVSVKERLRMRKLNKEREIASE